MACAAMEEEDSDKDEGATTVRQTRERGEMLLELRESWLPASLMLLPHGTVDIRKRPASRKQQQSSIDGGLPLHHLPFPLSKIMRETRWRWWAILARVTACTHPASSMGSSAKPWSILVLPSPSCDGVLPESCGGLLEDWVQPQAHLRTATGQVSSMLGATVLEGPAQGPHDKAQVLAGGDTGLLHLGHGPPCKSGSNP
ncbi:UNVERIFIED_CONTAM: hypothetical protein FKN15_027903 [Acipenser sinensis]